MAALIEQGGELPESPFVRHMVDLADAPGTDTAAFVACLRRPRTPLDEDQLAPGDRPRAVGASASGTTSPRPTASWPACPTPALQVLRGVDHSRTPSAMGFLDAALRFVEG